MEQNDKLQLFEGKHIRTAWDEEKEEWFFSVVDTDSENPRRYWSDLKRKIKAEGAAQLYEKNRTTENVIVRRQKVQY